MVWKADPSQYPAYLRRKVAKGRGCGSGEDYLPWLTTREIKSQGTCDNPTSVRNGRIYELLSDYESIYFHLLERKPSVVDVREQFPILDMERSLQLCTRFGVVHKRRGAHLDPYTIDFLVTERIDGEHVTRAASIKPPDVVNYIDSHTEAKLKIEQTWCRERGMVWELIDMSIFESPVTTLATLRFIRSWFAHRWEPDRELAEMFGRHFMHSFRRNVPLSELLAQVAKPLRLSRDLSEDVFRYSAWCGILKVSLQHEISLDQPLVLKNAI